MMGMMAVGYIFIYYFIKWFYIIYEVAAETGAIS